MSSRKCACLRSEDLHRGLKIVVVLEGVRLNSISRAVEVGLICEKRREGLYVSVYVLCECPCNTICSIPRIEPHIFLRANILSEYPFPW